jgi:hypothetical protein
VINKNAKTRWLRFSLKSLGPGIITGAADDDHLALLPILARVRN